MRSADSVQRRRARRRGFRASTLPALCFVCAAVVLAPAQSGRMPAPPAPPGDTRPRQVNQSPRERPRAFIVVTAPPDGSQGASMYVPSYARDTDLEELARGGCLVALKNLPGVKVVEDINVARWEARETALGEDEAWVVWLELTWTTDTTRGNAQPFKLRYLLFEPGTGKMVSSGYGRGIRQTWGRPAPHVDVEEQLRNAGRDVADQVISELSKTP